MRARLPGSYLAFIGALAVAGVFVALVYFGVKPFDNFTVFILTSVVGTVLLLLLCVIGGAFVGMLLAHRILANRQFSPFERTVMESLQEIRERLDRLERAKDEREEAIPRR